MVIFQDIISSKKNISKTQIDSHELDKLIIQHTNLIEQLKIKQQKILWEKLFNNTNLNIDSMIKNKNTIDICLLKDIFNNLTELYDLYIQANNIQSSIYIERWSQN